MYLHAADVIFFTIFISVFFLLFIRDYLSQIDNMLGRKISNAL